MVCDAMIGTDEDINGVQRSYNCPLKPIESRLRGNTMAILEMDDARVDCKGFFTSLQLQKKVANTLKIRVETNKMWESDANGDDDEKNDPSGSDNAGGIVDNTMTRSNADNDDVKNGAKISAGDDSTPTLRPKRKDHERNKNK